MWIFLLLYALAAWQDVKNRELDARLLTGFALLGFVRMVGLHLMGRAETTLPMQLAAFLVGTTMVLLSRVTGGALGVGDGLFLLVAAFYLCARELILMVLVGILVCGVLGGVVLIRGFWQGKDCRKLRLPLIPCMLPSVLFFVWLRLQAGGAK